MRVDYIDKTQLQVLADEVNKLTVSVKMQIIPRCIIKKLMIPPFSFRFISFFLTPKLIISAYMILFIRNPLLLHKTWDELINHMVNGKDYTDKKSAGGWNAEELAIFLTLVERYKL